MARAAPMQPLTHLLAQAHRAALIRISLEEAMADPLLSKVLTLHARALERHASHASKAVFDFKRLAAGDID